MNLMVEAVERGLVPQWVTRACIRRLNRQRLRETAANYAGSRDEAVLRFLSHMASAPIAVKTDRANDQHYELPPAFFRQVLGSRLKYSSAYWLPGESSLDRAEEEMLRRTCERAEIADGQEILELGCGWGSLTLWMAACFPQSRIVAVSNSSLQREYIERRCEVEGLTNVRVLTRNMNDLELDRSFDRVVSIEMFEHMRNYQELLRRIATWLRPEGRLFIHIFCHREYAYLFEEEGEHNWMGRHFFSGGMMPSEDLIAFFAQDLELDRFWKVGGEHYQKTAEAWLRNLDARRSIIMPLLKEHYGNRLATRWLERWRVFFMACAELFGHNGGSEWFVGHYLLKPTEY